MRAKVPNHWSLNRPSDLVFLSLGTAIGISNFFVLPSLVLYAGGLEILILHLITLFLLGAPLVLAEMIWGRWLLRPYTQSFRAVSPWLAWAPLIAVAVILFIAPPYFVELGRIFLLLVDALWRGGQPTLGLRTVLATSQWRSFLGATVMLTLAAWASLNSIRRVTLVMKAMLGFTIPVWVALCFFTLHSWGFHGLDKVLYWPVEPLTIDAIVKVCMFSLFTLSAGIGILFTYVYYSSQVAWRNDGLGPVPFWKRPSSLMRTVGWVVAGDLLGSITSIVLVSPYGLGAVGEGVKPVSSTTLILEWVPQILSPRASGGGLVIFHFAALLTIGFAAALSLFDWSVFHLEKELKWPRGKAVFHIWLLGLGLVTLSLIPLFKQKMNAFGSDFLLPLSALALCYAVGWKMPERAQKQIFGRGLVLDRLFLIWRFSVRFLTPLVLIYLLIRQF